ncbi:MAG: flagellar export chaperone FliS [Candidatus Omnitrophica bacterium]|nr:flagellar export chaperone FliS [Candidatus Omnitrophota bacterium]
MAKPHNEYVLNKVKTASPLELVVIAYDGAIGHLEKAKAEMTEKKYHLAGERIIKAQKLLRELRNALNMEVEEISGNLFAAYHVLDRQLSKAGKEKDTAIIDEVIKKLVELRETWQEIAKKIPLSEQQQLKKDKDFKFLNKYQ